MTSRFISSACRVGRRRRGSFTLVEILAAMVVLIIIMGFLFQFLSSAQKTWALTDTNARTYENAQVVLDMVTRELQSAVASRTPGAEIPFYVGEDSPSSGDVLLAFVAAVDPEGTAKSRLSEIQYVLDGFSLKRAQAGDDKSEWDFFGDTSSGSDWVATGASLQTVVDGVESIRFRCHHPDVSGGVMEGGSSGKSFYHLPKAVQITLSLFDPKMTNLPEDRRNQSLRTFTKTVYLSNR